MRKRFLRASAGIAMSAAMLSSAMPISAPAVYAADTVRIMPLGDSITYGMADEGGYRKYLSHFMRERGYDNLDFVGPEGSSSATFTYNGQQVTYDDNHAGYSGYSITDLQGGWSGKLNGILETMQSGDYIKKYSPDIILLQIGTNDIANGFLDGSEERLHKLLDYLTENMPANGTIFLTTIPDLGSGGFFGGDTNANIAKYNDIVKKVADEYSNVRFADIHSVVDGSKDLADGVHPNTEGYEKMAQYWADTLDNFLGGSAATLTPVTITQPVVTADASDSAKVLMSCDFESGADGWTGRGSASAAVDKSKAHSGSGSLFVSKRANDWNGAVVDLGYDFSAGNTYGFEAYILQNSAASLDFKLSLEYSSGGTTQYDKIALSPVKQGEWTKVENPSYTIPAGAENIKFYIEVPDDLSDFYVDDIRITGSASSAPGGPSTPSTPSTTVNAEKTTGKIKGDLDGDGMITSLDVVLMRKRLLSGFTDSKMKKAADIDRSGDTEIADLVQLQRFILGRIAQFEEVADPVNYDEPVEYEKSYNFPAVNKLPSSKDIPDPFIFMDGSKVESESDWWKRQAEISCMYEYYMYGKWIDGSDDETSYKINGNKMTITVKRKSTGKTASFDMVINRPKSVRHEGGAPVILGMHKGIAESTATSNGYAVITYDADGMFSAPGTAQDNNQHKGAFYDLYPYGNSFETQTGELMAWSWGLSRTLDALYAGAAKELNINPENAICTGVSRYGKATGVCGAFEKRFKMCAPSCSGAGGIALYRYRSQGKTYDFSSKGASSNYTYTENEPLGSLQASGEQAWFNGNFMQFRDVNNLPLDQHMLGSLCCDPDRYLFIIGSCVGEDWVNAPSMWMSYCGMRPIWDYVGLSDHLAINIHKEGHAVIAEDVEKMIQYFDYHVYGINPKMDLKELQTSVFDLPKNKDPFQDTLSSKWIH